MRQKGARSATIRPSPAPRHAPAGLNAEADRRAWRETANRWWDEHGPRSAPDICCGCGKPVSIADAIPLPHEQRVHDADCMTVFGRKWLKEAAEALARFGNTHAAELRARRRMIDHIANPEPFGPVRATVPLARID